jgi:outer membrane protein assembly factor BamB
MGQDTPFSVDEVTLSRCQDPAPVPVVTTGAPVRGDQALYVSTGDRLYALNAADGTARWGQQVALTRER